MANTTFDDLPIPGVGYPDLTDNFAISPTNLADPTYKYTWQEVINFVQANLTLTMQDIYNNSVTAGIPFVNLALGNPPQYVSTQTAVALNPPMTSTQRDALVLPLNSSTVYATDLNRICCQVGPAALPVWKSIAWQDDIPDVTVAIGEAYFTDNLTVTTIVDPTPVFIAGTFNSGANNVNFSESNGRLTNTSSVGITVQVSCSMTAYFDAGGTGLINAYIYKNGSAAGNLITQGSIDGVSSTPKPLVLTGTAYLDPGEYLEPFIGDPTGTYDIIVQSINFNAVTVNGAASTQSNQFLGTSVEPEITFPATVYTDLVISYSGTNVIVPESLAIGQTVELSITGIVSADFPLPNADGGSYFRLTIGSLTPFTTDAIYSTDFSNGAKLPWSLVINITRLSSGDISISAAGYYTNSLSVVLPIVFVIPADVYAYNSALSYPLTLEFLNGNSVGNVFSFIARNFKIVQYN